MTDLKAANEALAKAIAALESPEHDTDVREAEAIRQRLIELDERTGARIKAKLEAHREIADAWRAAEGQPVERVTLPAAIDETLSAAWQAHHQDYHTRYGLTRDQIVEPVLMNGVAEMQQDDVSRETLDEA